MVEAEKIEEMGTIEKMWDTASGKGKSIVINTVRYFLSKNKEGNYPDFFKDIKLDDLVKFTYTRGGADGSLLAIHDMSLASGEDIDRLHPDSPQNKKVEAVLGTTSSQVEAQPIVEKVNKQIATPSGDSAMFMKADDLDEDMILKEQLTGVEPMVYEIPTSKGKKYTLSWRGITEACRRQGNIHVESVRQIDLGKGIFVGEAVVLDLKNNVKMIGTAERATRPDFRYTTLTSKAIRNALKKVLSPKIEQDIIKEAQDAKSVIVIDVKDISQ